MLVHYTLETKFRKRRFYPIRSIFFYFTHVFSKLFSPFKEIAKVPYLGNIMSQTILLTIRTDQSDFRYIQVQVGLSLITQAS
jgi:hypothetical protein